MTEFFYEDFEPVIGLEIHVQLNTKSKIFSSAPNRFGDEPNTNIGIVDTGQPGSLPILNAQAVHKAVQFGCAIQARVAEYSAFDRKSYFYPDSPRNFQITQFYHPIIIGGSVVAEVGGETRHFAIHHAHLEDDAGMLKHFSSFAGVDYNRAGVGLLEIVSEPCMHSPGEASAYAMAVKALMQYLDASDCNMEEGSLRMDVNISVRHKTDKKLRKKIEIKNLNSFHTMEMAIEAEIRRQVRLYQAHPRENPDDVLTSGTYRFDVEKKETILMRTKEAAEDYRYFPEPDLPPLILTEEYIQSVKASLPELPQQRLKRYVSDMQLPSASATILINEKRFADYFEQALKICHSPKNLCNWLIVEFVGRFKDTGTHLLDSGILPEHIGKLVQMIESGTITGKIAKSVADDMVATPGKDPELIVQENPDYTPISDTSSIESLVDEVLSANAQSVADFKAGKGRAFDYLVGQVMKRCKGKASPALVHQCLTQKLKE